MGVTLRRGSDNLATLGLTSRDDGTGRSATRFACSCARCVPCLPGGLDRPREASPSLVYGAALLMRLGVTPPPGFESPSLRGRSHPMLADNRTSARSSMDRASDYGSEGWEFESLRARHGNTVSDQSLCEFSRSTKVV